MVRRISGRRVLVLCSDAALRESLRDLLAAYGYAVTCDSDAGVSRHALVMAASDAWPSGWNFAVLRTACRRLPCIVLSGSPLGGHFIATQLQRGYFLQLPALPNAILALAAELSGA